MNNITSYKQLVSRCITALDNNESIENADVLLLCEIINALVGYIEQKENLSEWKNEKLHQDSQKL